MACQCTLGADGDLYSCPPFITKITAFAQTIGRLSDHPPGPPQHERARCGRGVVLPRRGYAIRLCFCDTDQEPFSSALSRSEPSARHATPNPAPIGVANMYDVKHHGIR